MPTHEECYWAMLCYNSMFAIEHRHLRELLLADERPSGLARNLKADHSFNMYKVALSKSPKDYLGPSNDPGNEAYQRFRKMGNKLLDKFLGER